MVSDCHLLSCRWASVRRTWLCLPYVLPSGILSRGQGLLSVGLLVMFFLMQPRMLLAFLGTKAYYWFMLNFFFTKIHRSFSAKLPSRLWTLWDPDNPFLQMPEVPLNSLTCQALLRVLDCLLSCWGCISPVIQVIDGGVGPYLPLGCSGSYWPPAGLCATRRSPLDPQFSRVSVHLTVHLSNLYFISFSEAFMSECFESLAGVKVNNICCSPCIHKLVTALH